MHKLRCGVIYTNAFAEYLTQLSRTALNFVRPRVLSLEYLRSADGKAAWWQMDWIPEGKAPEECRFVIGHIPVALSKQSQRGLKNRCLDWRDGRVVVRS